MSKTEFLDKAKNNLAVARICHENRFYDACANRAYFATFQAAIAALTEKGMKRGKYDHKWVQAEFGEKLIKRQKVYPAKLKSYLLEMQIIRNRADYENRHVSRKDASDQLGRAEEMIGFIIKEIEKC
jgi:uncharacterized protein (UPF0332 family)